MRLFLKDTFSYFLATVFSTLIISYSTFSAYGFDEMDIENDKTDSLIVTLSGSANFVTAARAQKSYYSDKRLPDSALNTSTWQGSANRNSNALAFVNDYEIYVQAIATTQNGSKYGAFVEIETDISTGAAKQGFNADKAYVFTENRIGRFEIGNNIAANQKMKVGPAYFARAAGGINGRYLEYINLPMYSNSTRISEQGIICRSSQDTRVSQSPLCANTFLKSPRFILVPQSPIGHGGYAKGFYSSYKDYGYAVNDEASRSGRVFARDGSLGEAEDATKISFYTPRIDGWRFGVSYTPDTNNMGATSTMYGSEIGGVKNVISAGASHSGMIDNLGYAFSATGEMGRYDGPLIYQTSHNQGITRSDLRSYDIGWMMTYFGLSLGASYGYWGTSLQDRLGVNSCDYDPSSSLNSQNCSGSSKRKFRGANYYTAGIAYEFGPVGISVTGIKSEFEKNRYKAISTGIDYRIAKGLLPYIEVTKFEFESNQPKYTNNGSAIDFSAAGNNNRQLKDNSGIIVLAGVLVSF